MRTGARRVLRRALRPLAGRDCGLWRWIGSPGLRYVLFRDPIDCVVFGLLASRPRVSFLQIGSNDGRSADPLWAFRGYPNWRGVLVEPFEPAFRRLQASYGRWPERFRLVNAAVAPSRGPRAFYYVRGSGANSGPLDQLGSLHEQIVREGAHFVGEGSACIARTEVDCVRLDDLLEPHDLGEIDLLYIDAEGSDLEILRQVDWRAHRPSVVVFEHVHLTDEGREEADALLREAGYELAAIGRDTLGVRTAALESMPPLSRAWSLITAVAARGRRGAVP